MAMEPEMKQLLTALAEGQVRHDGRLDRLDGAMVKLAEGQVELTASVSKLDVAMAAMLDRQGRMEERQGRMEERQGRMESAIEHLATATEAALERVAEGQEMLGERLDRFRKDVLTGFTHSAERDRRLDDRVRKLEKKGRAKAVKRTS